MTERNSAGQDSLEETDVVRVVWLALEDMLPLYADLEALLTAEECMRAGSLTLLSSRKSFVTGRAVLRLLLGGRLGLAAAKVEFSYGRAGKPELWIGYGGGWTFSVSHSGGLVAIALGRGFTPLGIDVERVVAEADVAGLAETAWGRAAGDRLRQIENTKARALEFYGCWVKFEAQHKLKGEGVFAARRASLAAGAQPHTFELEWNGARYLGALACDERCRVRALDRLGLIDVAQMLGR